MLDAITRKWWLLFVRGLCAILFGVLAVAWPGITLAALVLIFGVYAIVDGIVAISLGLAAGVDGFGQWWQMLLVGIVSLCVGIATFVWPGMTAVVLLAWIAALAILRGIAELAAAVRLRALIQNEWLLVLSAICSILFGVALIARPAAGALAVLWLIGTFAILFGGLLVAFSLKVRSLNTRLSNVGRGTPAIMR